MRDAIREVFAHETVESPDFPVGKEHRKHWEIAMAILALRDGGVLRPDAEVLGIGAGSEATLFWLTNHVRRVWATDLYADPGKWIGTAPPTMLASPGDAWQGPWNPRKLVVQHMDACELCYEDETFDGIFSSGSIEHFGSLERIELAMDEAFRVLKRGGTASFSTEFLIEGDPLEFEADMVMFTPELIERYLTGDRDWATVSPVVYAVSEATIGTALDAAEYAAREASGGSVYPHCALRVGSNLITSVHLALRKAENPRKPPTRKAARPRISSRSAGTEAPGTTAGLVVAEPIAPLNAPSGREQPPDGIATLSPVNDGGVESNAKRVARRLAGPVLSPIDGRVADINRRIEHYGLALERTFDANARSSSEAATYIGVELRRVQDQLAALEDRIDEYHLLLGQVVDLPIENLDQSLANLINYATSFRGFYAQGGVWFNPPVEIVLSPGAASVVQVSERIVEVPFAMAALGRVKPGARILDVGSAESTFPLSAASLGYRVTAIDPRPLPYSHPNLESHAARFEEWDAPSDRFAGVFLISTIEHVGLSAYGERAYGSPEPCEGADLDLINRVHGLLAPDGIMVLTTPYGQRETTELERIYDDESLRKLLADWEIVERQIVVRRDALTWETDDKIVTGARGVVMLIASPKQS